MQVKTKASAKELTRKQAVRRRQFPLLMMLVPGTLLLIAFRYLPMFGIFLAFKDYKYNLGIFGSPWCGFNNFSVLFKNPNIWLITKNTVCYNLGFLALNTFLALLVSILLNEVTNKLASKVYQTVMLLPHFLSWVIVGYLVYSFLSVENGLINVGILRKMGLPEIAWYSETKYWPFILCFVNSWKCIGYNSVVYLAAISGISQEYYEAAFIDGAGRVKQVWYITIPCLLPTIVILLILGLGGIFGGDFGLFYQVPMHSGMLSKVTSVLPVYVYELSGDVGMGTAAGLYQGVVGFLMVVFTNSVVNKISPELALY